MSSSDYDVMCCPGRTGTKTGRSLLLTMEAPWGSSINGAQWAVFGSKICVCLLQFIHIANVHPRSLDSGFGYSLFWKLPQFADYLFLDWLKPPPTRRNIWCFVTSGLRISSGNEYNQVTLKIIYSSSFSSSTETILESCRRTCDGKIVWSPWKQAASDYMDMILWFWK